MENKKTTELIDLLKSLVDSDGSIKNQEKYDEVWEQLKEREPFFTILNDDFDEAIPAILDRIKDLEAEIKLLKRHKHDEKSGDVLVRI